MGCGSSSNAAVTTLEKEPDIDIDRESENSSDELKEPEIDPLPLDNILPEYPPPSPSGRKKKDIFQQWKYQRIEKHVRSAPVDVGNSFEALVAYLTQGITNDIEKVRAIFVWIGSQTKVLEGPADSPNYIMAMVRNREISYSYIFTRLCRAAGIPCVIIPGLAKSVGYEVGDSVDEVRTLTNKWNAVYVDKEWRLVFVLWAFTAVSGYSSGKYTLVETEGNTVSKKEEASSGMDTLQFNEYYFLTDPEEFVHFAMATDPAWQLLQQPFTIEKFSSTPNFEQSYFCNDVKLKSEFNSRLYSQNGETSVVFEPDDPSWDGYLNYELFYNDVESEFPLPDSSQLPRHVFMGRENGKWNFQIRYPSSGVYKLTINIGKGGFENWLCHFKLYGDKVANDIKPYPCTPGNVGWGPNILTEKGGLSSPSQKNSIVHVSSMKATVFKFSLIKTVTVRSELVHNEIATVDLQQYVKQTVEYQQLQVDVTLPQEGEYGLRLYSKFRNATSEANVCNYLMISNQNSSARKTRRENARERMIRSTLKDVTETKSLQVLTDAIEKFRKHKLQDNGDLQKAIDRQEYLTLLKDLKDAINRRHPDPLDRAIARATDSAYESELSEYINAAKEIRENLRRLGRYTHDIMEMKQSTVSEVHSYPIPQQIFRDIMIATYLLLGEPVHHLKNWYYLQILMKTLGKESLLSRIRSFNSRNVSESTVTEVKALLDKYDEDSVRLASPAAGTFYRWATEVLTSIRNERNTS